MNNIQNIFNVISETKSSRFNIDVLPNIYDPLVADLFCRNVMNRIDVVYKYQGMNGINWLNLLHRSPETFVLLFSKFEPLQKSINDLLNFDINNTLIFFMCYIYARDSQLFYTNNVFLNDFMNNNTIRDQRGDNDFNNQLNALRNDINIYVDKMLTTLDNIKTICNTLDKINNRIELDLIERLFKSNFSQVIPMASVLDDIDIYNKLLNSISDIQNTCASFSENVDTGNGLKAFRIGWYTNEFLSQNANVGDIIRTYSRNFARGSLRSLTINNQNNIYNYDVIQLIDNNWNNISLLLKDKTKMYELYEWYDWASQFWLKKSYNTWFKTYSLLFKKIFENVTMIYRTTDILIVDASTSGVFLFVYNLLTELNMPNLQTCVITTMGNEWYIPPETAFKIRTNADYITLDYNENNEPFKTLYEKNNYIVTKLKERTLQGLNTMIYTDDMSLISRLVINNIDVNVTSYHMEPYNIRKMRNHILENNIICGPYTRHVEPSTRIYTYLFLIFLSRCSGLPIYSIFGLGNMLSMWKMIIKSNLKSVDRKNPNDTSPWLARVKVNNVIELNGIMITELIIRSLGNSFKSDKIKTNKTRQNGYSIYLKKAYDKMKEDNIFDSTRCKPVVINRTWLEKWNLNVQNNDTWEEPNDDEQKENDDERNIYVSEPFEGDDMRFEWCMGQRLIFEKNFYYPKDIDSLLHMIKLRFKNWCQYEYNVIMSITN